MFALLIAFLCSVPLYADAPAAPLLQEADAAYAKRSDLVEAKIAWVDYQKAQAADQLKDQRTKHPFIRHARFNTFGNDTRLIDHIALEVAIFAITALLHGRDRTHAGAAPRAGARVVGPHVGGHQ